MHNLRLTPARRQVFLEKKRSIIASAPYFLVSGATLPQQRNDRGTWSSTQRSRAQECMTIDATPVTMPMSQEECTLIKHSETGWLSSAVLFVCQRTLVHYRHTYIHGNNNYTTKKLLPLFSVLLFITLQLVHFTNQSSVWIKRLINEILGGIYRHWETKNIICVYTIGNFFWIVLDTTLLSDSIRLAKYHTTGTKTDNKNCKKWAHRVPIITMMMISQSSRWWSWMMRGERQRHRHRRRRTRQEGQECLMMELLAWIREVVGLNYLQ